jgi:NAD(P)-dependent dehydrogenase (short-subunit alcohol dehydrogenase family)
VEWFIQGVEEMSDMQGARRRVLITGGASGFGLAIARTLLTQRARVAIGDIDSERLEEAVRNLDNAADVLPLKLDVTSPVSVKAAVATCQETFGGLDTLINSAGVIHFAPLAEIREADWDRVVDVDLKGPFLCSQAAAPLLCESGRRGRIVNIGSDAAKVGCPMILSYCAAKFGVVGLTKALAAELAPYEVTVNCVCPVGVSTTGMGQTVIDWKMGATGQKTDEILAETAAGIPLKRNATVADVVNAVMFFLSDASAFLTGVALDVDGGLLSTMPIPGAKE